MKPAPATRELFDVTCPFCGLLCDDLEIRTDGTELAVSASPCTLRDTRFALAALPSGPRLRPAVDGVPSTLDQAVARAAGILGAARQPLLGGLGTDTAGLRSVMRLADRCGAVVDHMNRAATSRNIRVLQDSGWVTTTLSEVFNHADLVIVLGQAPMRNFPRLWERILSTTDPRADRRRPLFLGEPGRRRVIALAADGPAGPTLPPGDSTTTLDIGLEQLGAVAALLRALLADAPLQSPGIGGLDIASLSALAEALRQARYSVVIWAAGEWTFPHAGLAIEMWCELARDLNRSTRSAVLPLGGSEGDLSANQVCTWQAGYPLPTAFARACPEHDPYLYDSARMLERGEADALLWVSSFSPEAAPPASALPTIVVGHPGHAFSSPPAVFIPVGVPGIDHAGHLYRADSVVALPLSRLRDSGLPSAASVIDAITGRLPAGAGA